jgi:hypothetical protein
MNREPSNDNDNAEAPFFIVGALRSGTTLMRLMIGHHPNICRCEEMEYVAPTIVKHQGIPDDVSEYKEFLSTDKNFRLSNYVVPEHTTFIDIVQDFFRQLRETDKKPIFGTVVHHHYEQLPLIWPNSKYIFLNRDPRDVARSCVQMGWNGTPWRASRFWIEAYESWLLLSAKLPEDRKLEITYEALIANPEDVLKKVCSFLNVKYTSAILEINQSTTYSKPSAKKASSWRVSASDDEIMQVEAKIGKRLEESGYQHSGFPELKLSFYNKARIKVQDFINRTAFRCKRYGVFLWFANIIARRLPFASFNNRIKLQVEKIDIKHHK